MVNAWSLLYDVLNGTLDKEYPIVNKKEVDETNFDLDKIERMGGFEWTPGSPWPPTIVTGKHHIINSKR